MRTEIIVALIGVSGVVSAAVIANADKLFGDEAAPPPAAAAQQAAASGAGLVNTDAQALPALQQAKPSGETPAAAPRAIPDVSGVWLASDGSRFDFSQAGASYGFVHFKYGRQIGSGAGTLSGNRFTHRFEAEGTGAGSCAGSVAADGQTSSGHCRADGGGEWDYTVSR